MQMICLQVTESGPCQLIDKWIHEAAPPEYGQSEDIILDLRTFCLVLVHFKCGCGVRVMVMFRFGAWRDVMLVKVLPKIEKQMCVCSCTLNPSSVMQIAGQIVSS